MERLHLKIFYLKKRIIFPYSTISVILRSSQTTSDIKKGDKIIAYTIRSMLDILFCRNRLATLSEVADISIDEKTAKIQLKGMTRVRIKKIIKYQSAEFELIPADDNQSSEYLKDELRKKSQELIFLINIEESDKLIYLLNYLFDLNQMTDFIANYFIMNFRDRYNIFYETDVIKRGKQLIAMLDAMIIKLNKKRKRETT